MQTTERKSFIGLIAWVGIGLALIHVLTGCMQVTGAKRIDAWGLVIEANNGFEAKAGVQQYDRVYDTRGIGGAEPKALTPGVSRQAE